MGYYAAIENRRSVDLAVTSPSQLDIYKESILEQFQSWCSPISELIQGAESVIKYGLYDRPQLELGQWVGVNGRVVLICDAAHSTSPHLGQGANQALGDCFHLATPLPEVQEGEREFGMDGLGLKRLKEVFEAFAEERQPRMAALVKGARAQGDRRGLEGDEACKKRDEDLRTGWEDGEGVERKWKGLLRELF